MKKVVLKFLADRLASKQETLSAAKNRLVYEQNLILACEREIEQLSQDLQEFKELISED